MSAVYFRTDGNEEIATGHIMRCLSIARACAKLHAEICFLVSDETSMTILQERLAFPDEFPIRCLHSNYKDLEAELPALKDILYKASDWLFVDSYFVTEAYMTAIHKLCQVAYLDDMLAFNYPADLIINYDVTDEPACYHKASRKLLGSAYTPLRKQFQNVSYEIHSKVQHILISTGGTDVYNVAGQLLTKIFTVQTAASISKCHYHIITSRLNSHFQELEQLSYNYPNLHIHENITDMAALMCQCDLAVSAGGTTLYELCAVGVPTISFTMADNQLTAVETFAERGIIPYAGDVRLSFGKVIDTMIMFLTEKSSSFDMRKKSSHAMRAFIDGHGSDRIADALVHP